MLAIYPKSSSPNSPPPLIPNRLPCQIQHNGPITVTQRHWAPQAYESRTAASHTDRTAQQPPPKNTESPSDVQIAYLRGRKLLGRTLALPKGYEGVVLQRTERIVPGLNQKLPATAPSVHRFGDEADENADEDAGDETAGEATVEVKLMERIADFDEIVVWGHEEVPGEDDVYVKGLEEWVGFAETVSFE